MKKLFLFLFLFSYSVLQSQTISIETFRKEYYKLNTDSTACAKLYKKVSEINQTDVLFNGYKGAISASMANHVKSKQEKIKLFNAGKKLLEQSISADSTNTELRFLRLTIQSNCPKALGYYRNINTDKKYILSHFDSIKNTTVKNRMAEYLVSSTLLTEEEKKKINAAKR
jgi:hypothetical protein